MNRFGLLFYATLACVVSAILFAALSLDAASSRYQGWALSIECALRVCATYAPLQILWYTRERRWVLLMFLPWFLINCVTLGYLALYETSLLSSETLTVLVARGIINVGAIVAIILVLAGCYSVQVPLVRSGFRRVGWWIIGSIVLLGAAPLMAISHWGATLSLKTAISAIPFIPLAMITYRVWKSGPLDDQWEASVERIGEPEEDLV
jgi:hypothetical protein